MSLSHWQLLISKNIDGKLRSKLVLDLITFKFGGGWNPLAKIKIFYITGNGKNSTVTYNERAIVFQSKSANEKRERRGFCAIVKFQQLLSFISSVIVLVLLFYFSNLDTWLHRLCNASCSRCLHKQNLASCITFKLQSISKILYHLYRLVGPRFLFQSKKRIFSIPELYPKQTLCTFRQDCFEECFVYYQSRKQPPFLPIIIQFRAVITFGGYFSRLRKT